MDSPPMATFAGRRAPNVSQYIAELNVVRPEPDDALAADDAYDFETNLNLFTNAEFLDYPVDDIALDQSVLDYTPSQEEQGTRASFVAKEDYPHGLDFVNSMCTPSLSPSENRTCMEGRWADITPCSCAVN